MNGEEARRRMACSPVSAERTNYNRCCHGDAANAPASATGQFVTRNMSNANVVVVLYNGHMRGRQDRGENISSNAVASLWQAAKQETL